MVLAGPPSAYEGDLVAELKFIGNLMDHTFFPEAGLFGGQRRRFCLPHNYIVFDIETSGFSPQEDVIVEFGWAIVQDHQATDYGGVMLDWSQFDPDNANFHEWLRWRLAKTAADCAKQGRHYHFTYDRLKAEGVHPLAAVRDFSELLKAFLSTNAYLVGHGAWKFDRVRIDNITEQFLGYKLPWDNSPLFDTGLVEKACQLNKVPCDSETLNEWYQRVNGQWSKKKWNLDGHCASKYNLAERFNLDLRYSHTAGFDCLLTHSLAETYRQIGEACRGLEYDS